MTRIYILLAFLYSSVGQAQTIANPKITGRLLLQNPSGAQPELHLSEDPDNGSNVLIFKAPATLASDYTFTLPVDDGTSDQVLATNGSGVLSWAAALTNPMDSAGDMIYGGASGVVTKLDSGTASMWLLSGGAGAPTWTNTTTTGKIIDTAADEVALRVTGHSTQTSDLMTVEKSDGTDVLNVTNVNGTKIRGTTTNDSAATGFVGEYIENNRSSAMPNVTSGEAWSCDVDKITYVDTAETGIALTAGDWDISGCIYFNGASGTIITDASIWIGTAKGNDTTGQVTSKNFTRLNATLAASGSSVLCTPVWRTSLSGSQTYYLKGKSTFTTSTLNATGNIRARRIR